MKSYPFKSIFNIQNKPNQIFLTPKLVLILILLFISSVNPIFSQASKGTCSTWIEGDSQSLVDCKESTLEECAKDKKSIQKKDTAFQNYTGKLFKSKNTDASEIFEFKNESVDNCKKQMIQSAREAEGTMCSEWGFVVYSEGLKAGDAAYIYGKSVNLRESASTKSKSILTPADRTKIKILEKSKERATIPNLYKAYWFKISVGDKTGWVYGQFLHPDPNSNASFIEQ
ncbi:MAG TPA: SH3 domain-containing protein [Leptospiraceae bacterium]|nr:SH3 domain-containing protein [Leptospiraceae bacterium]HRG74777.1 SH3 domain-containing protein [Leptospiraceae bacterium]